jgi:hypothetical protein
MTSEIRSNLTIVRAFTQVSILVLALSVAQAVANQRDSDELSVRLSLDKQRYEVGERIQVEVRVENQSDQALVVSNLISEVDNSEGYVAFKLIDAAGHGQPPQTRLIGDSFAPFPQKPDWRTVLGRWLVLHPKDSIASHLELDQAMFPSLTEPGKYEISATYSSAGLSYGLNYGSLGLTAQDVASLPFRSWSGKVQSNSVWVTIVNGKVPSGKQ